MSTLTFSVEDAQSQLRDLLAMALKGGEVIIAEDEKPMVRLVPVEAIESEFVSSEKKRIFGLHRGQIWVSEDFDDPLPDEFWLGEE